MSGIHDRQRRGDPDGVRISASSRTGRPWVAVAALVATAAAVWLVLRPAPASRPAPAPAPVTIAAEERSRGAAPRPVKVLPQARPRAGAAPAARPVRDPVPPIAPAAPATDAPAAAEDDAASAEKDAGVLSAVMHDVVEGMRAAGGKEGIAVYPPKGTDPPKPGIVVPEDFPLPEGYVRYHQVTDDGRRLEPILMFSPDYDFVDADGQPLVVPESGIVPPEMAPPGLPIQMLEVPGAPGAGTRR